MIQATVYLVATMLFVATLVGQHYPVSQLLP